MLINATDSNAFVSQVNAFAAARIAKEGVDITKAKLDEIVTGQRAMSAAINVEFIAAHNMTCDLGYFDKYAKGIRETRAVLEALRNGAKRTAENKTSNTTSTLLRQIIYIANKRKDKVNEQGKLVLSHNEVQKGLSSVVAGFEGVKYDHCNAYRTKDTVGTTGAQSSLFMSAMCLLGLSVKVGANANLTHEIDIANTAFDFLKAEYLAAKK